MAAVSRQTPESERNNQSQNPFVQRMTEVYIIQVSEKTEGRVT